MSVTVVHTIFIHDLILLVDYNHFAFKIVVCFVLLILHICFCRPLYVAYAL